MKKSAEKTRCSWASNDALYMSYHDEEWGVPCYDDRHLFEMLCLEGAQAGLSWITVLRKRTDYRLLFDNFDAHKMAKYKMPKIDALLNDPRIIRNKLKVNAFIVNAQAYLKIKEERTFSDFIWQFVDYQPQINHWKNIKSAPVSTAHSEAMSKALKQHGFKFVGPTICYAYMQAVGMVNDHAVDCFRYKLCAQ